MAVPVMSTGSAQNRTEPGVTRIMRLRRTHGFITISQKNWEQDECNVRTSLVARRLRVVGKAVLIWFYGKER